MIDELAPIFGSSTAAFDLVEGIYAAVQTPAHWPAVMAKISSALGGESIAWFAGFTGESVQDVMALANFDEGAWPTYAAHYAAINPIMPRCEAFFSPEETWYSDRAISDHELERTEYYADFFRPNHMHYSVGLRIQLPGQLPASLSCQRPKSHGAFGAQADAVYSVLRPHLTRALSLHAQLSRMQAQVLGLQGALEAYEHAVFGIAANGRVAFANRPAQALVQAADGVLLTGSQLFATDYTANTALRSHITAAVATGQQAGLSAGASLLLPRNGDRPALRATVTPIAAPHVPGSAQLVALVFVSDPSKVLLSRGTALRALFGLTPTEVRVADLLLQGADSSAVATATGTTLETARYHLKRVLTKTGTHRQVDLMRLMMALPHTQNG